jgi:ribosomal-protein-alanine N-acetyltransferase
MIKTLSLEDFDKIWAIEKSAHTFPWSLENLSQQLRKKSSNFGLYHEGTLVAFACIERIFPEAELFNIAVNPAYQGQGFGKKLLQTLMQKLCDENFERIFLEVRASNTPAIKLYETLGFNQMGVRKNYYPNKIGREDALLYASELCLLKAP